MAKRTDRVVMVRGVPKVVRFSGWERFGHLVHLFSFLTLALTGFFLYMPFLSAYAVGEAGGLSRMIHRIAAVVFMVNPLVYLIFDASGFFSSLGQVFRWTKDDFSWLTSGGFGSYWTGKKKGLPPLGKFGPGQKLNGLVQVIAFIVFAVTGLVMWFGKEAAGIGLFQTMVVLHDLAMLFAVGFFLAHFFLGVINPFTRVGASSIVDGLMTVEDAKAAHERWFEEGVRNKELIKG